MTPAQREIVHQSIQNLGAEITKDELIHPFFDVLTQCPHSNYNDLQNGGSQE
jgi:hypothetical protein